MKPVVTLQSTFYSYNGLQGFDWLKFELSLCKDVHVPIGSAELFCLDASRYSPAELRNIADSLEFHLYQTLSSVRIYPSKDEAKRDEQTGFLQHDQSVFEPSELPTSFLKRGQYEHKKFKKKTGTVWGKLVLLRSFHIEAPYRGQGYGMECMKQMISFCERIGADFFLLKPFPSEREPYIDEDTQLVNLRKLKKEIRGLVHFYQKLGFAETIGRCDELSMYRPLQPTSKQTDWHLTIEVVSQHKSLQVLFKNRSGMAS